MTRCVTSDNKSQNCHIIDPRKFQEKYWFGKILELGKWLDTHHFYSFFFQHQINKSTKLFSHSLFYTIGVGHINVAYPVALENE